MRTRIPLLMRLQIHTTTLRQKALVTPNEGEKAEEQPYDT